MSLADRSVTLIPAVGIGLIEHIAQTVSLRKTLNFILF